MLLFLHPLHSYTLVHPGVVCLSIEVTGDDYGNVKGVYYTSEEKSDSDPEKPTYKLDGKDRYIYYDNSWEIGDSESYWYKSKKCQLTLVIYNFYKVQTSFWPRE